MQYQSSAVRGFWYGIFRFKVFDFLLGLFPAIDTHIVYIFLKFLGVLPFLCSKGNIPGILVLSKKDFSLVSKRFERHFFRNIFLKKIPKKSRPPVKYRHVTISTVAKCFEKYFKKYFIYFIPSLARYFFNASW